MEQQIPQVGQRVELVHMAEESNPVEAGTLGTVTHIDHWGCAAAQCNIHVKWDNGRTLAILPDVDRWIVRG